MPLSIKDAETGRLISEERKRLEIDALVDEVMRIGRHFAALPIRDPRSIEELLTDLMQSSNEQELDHE